MIYEVDRESLIKRINTLRSPEGYLYAGSPNFLGLFGRDSLISSWQMFDTDISIAKSTLVALAKIQGTKVVAETEEEPGKIAHEYYSKESTPKEWFDTYKAPAGWLKIGRPEYLSIDSTPLFLIVLSKYYNKTGDKNMLKELWPNATLALDWIINYGIKDGLVKYVPKGGKLKSQSWKDGIGSLLDDALPPVAIVEVQGYAYKAMNDMIELMHVMDDTERLTAVQNTANELKENFEKKFWMEEKGYYALGIDGSGNQIMPITSNPGQLLFTGILKPEKVKAVVGRIFKNDIFTPYGIRTHSKLEPQFDPILYQLGSVWPHDNWIIAQGLWESGYQKEYESVKSALVKAAIELQCVPEYYGVSVDEKLIAPAAMRWAACDPQAWSLGALIDMLGKK